MMPDLSYNWQQLMDVPTEPSPRSAGQQSQPTFSAQNMRMQPGAPRVQVPNFQLTGTNAARNAARMDRAPALNRGLGANTAFAPFEPAANVSVSTCTYQSLRTWCHPSPSLEIFDTLQPLRRFPFFSCLFCRIFSSSLRITHFHGQDRISANTSLSDSISTAILPNCRHRWLFLCNATHPSTQNPACPCTIFKGIWLWHPPTILPFRLHRSTSALFL